MKTGLTTAEVTLRSNFWKKAKMQGNGIDR